MYIVTTIVRNPLFPFHSTPAQVQQMKIYGKEVGGKEVGGKEVGGKKSQRIQKRQNKKTQDTSIRPEPEPTRYRKKKDNRDEEERKHGKRMGADIKGSGAARKKSTCSRSR
jgi:hypothetical protein